MLIFQSGVETTEAAGILGEDRNVVFASRSILW
jgi:hypothetical protein